ncbi:hypothetical protein BCR44DRAFT_1431242 [Catenaria anguillulae PL171]|uniref:Uncharacterized protein n=1 Tax=Catenaria anguillulae PL171 TaxID=765915 RepID=A0A1Y2HQV9_9FUNG|nr:hypothetical protein BCR44DRAFT_1431242 [Catenaria anguillulae PL171]
MTSTLIPHTTSCSNPTTLRRTASRASAWLASPLTMATPTICSWPPTTSFSTIRRPCPPSATTTITLIMPIRHQRPHPDSPRWNPHPIRPSHTNRRRPVQLDPCAHVKASAACRAQPHRQPRALRPALVRWQSPRMPRTYRRHCLHHHRRVLWIVWHRGACR